jgi:hypothetical protein
MSDTSEGAALLETLRAIVERSTWLVYFREACPPHSMFRGTDPISGRSIVIGNPADREQVLAGLRTLNVPHELAEPEEDPHGA